MLPEGAAFLDQREGVLECRPGLLPLPANDQRIPEALVAEDPHRLAALGLGLLDRLPSAVNRSHWVSQGLKSLTCRKRCGEHDHGIGLLSGESREGIDHGSGLAKPGRRTQRRRTNYAESRPGAEAH